MSGETKVYCLFHGSYSDRYLVGVYATLEDAQAHPHRDYRTKYEHEPVWKLWDDDPAERRWDCIVRTTDRWIWSCEYDIDERVLGEPVSVSDV